MLPVVAPQCWTFPGLQLLNQISGRCCRSWLVVEQMFEWEPCLLLLVWKLSWILPHPPSQRPVPKRQIMEEYIKGGCLKKGTLNINHTCFKTPGPPPFFVLGLLRGGSPGGRYRRRRLSPTVRPCFPSLIIPLFSRQISSSKSTLGGKTPSAMVRS